MQEHGARRLQEALAACCGGVVFVRDKLVPLLQRLGSDALCRGTCQQPLAQLLGVVYRVPGLLGSLRAALEARHVQGPAAVAAVGWFVLQVASQIEGARSDPEVQQLLPPLEAAGGAAAAAAQQMRVLLGSSNAAAGGAAAPGSSAAGGPAAMLAVADLQAMAGGRHDNDREDFRDIAIMPTAEEVRHRLAPVPARA
jgi:hypothetical protein